MVKYLIIFNPVAGKGAAVNRLKKVRDFLDERNTLYEVIQTKRVGHAAEIADAHAKDQDTAIIAAGGDGTSNEVINGLMRGKGETTPLFGILPLGRGNDFSYGCGISPVFEEAVKTMFDCNSSPMDVGLIKGGDYPEGRYFGNGIGCGFDTVVGLEAAKMKHVHGAMAYVFGTIRTLIKFSDSPEIEVTRNGNSTVLRAIQISIMNGTRMGGSFFMAPEAVNDDGKLDISMLEHQNRRSLIRTIMHYTKGTQKGLPGLTMDRADSFRLKAIKGGMVVHADGETICTEGKELDISCIPSPLNIIH